MKQSQIDALRQQLEEAETALLNERGEGAGPRLPWTYSCVEWSVHLGGALLEVTLQTGATPPSRRWWWKFFHPGAEVPITGFTHTACGGMYAAMEVAQKAGYDTFP